ncbi:uncharacterized protein LOC129981728 isoform X1 [Argiope bruennichi]|uniref:uncharacterized protein LOC129981728 isoform X1 n=1 Tax=Argiope bruennichi TaxID=94029 RepID=UPI0024950038|nr:uncharacterized protein LOC129981728 isoform X1 [Argiope bruennichi]
MELVFMPSLQHSATIKFALKIIIDHISEVFQELTQKTYLIEKTSFDFSGEQERWMITQKITRSLTNFVPDSLLEPTTHCIYLMISEIHYWIRDHYSIITYIEKRYFRNHFSWGPEGTIDREKTAKALIQNKSIDITVRFVIACIYFFEYDILILWSLMTELQKGEILHIDSNPSVQFWMKWLRINTKPTRAQWIRKYLSPRGILQIIIRKVHRKPKRCGRIRLSAIFMHLHEQSRLFDFKLWSQHVHFDDFSFYLCYQFEQQMSLNAYRAKILSKKLSPIDVLKCYMTSQFKFFLLSSDNHPNIFETFLHDVLCVKILHGVHDFDYLQVFNFLRLTFPHNGLKLIQKRSYFPLMHTVMKCDFFYERT